MTSESAQTADASTSQQETPSYPLLEAPADGIPEVIETTETLAEAAAAIAVGRGPVALDAERASGYRYGNRAFLVQLRREGAGSFLIDPIACPDLSSINDAIGDAEWVLHAATQDLPCLAEVGLRPVNLFDTELGSRLAGLPRVGLSAVIEHYLGLTLAKEHSAVDWSTRPLPTPWLTYAALDVEVLVQVRDRLRDDLESQGKLDWALQDFAALLDFTGPPSRQDPWRRTSGMHRVRDRRAIARVRELWQTRDDLARRRDIAPGRVLPDAFIVEIAVKAPRTSEQLTNIAPSPGASSRGRARPPHRGLARHEAEWLEAVRQANQLTESLLPTPTVRNDGPPPQRSWADKDPVAAARLGQVREAMDAFATERVVPIENLITPDTLRRVLWSPPQGADLSAVGAALARLGARPWQVDIVAPLIVQAICDHPVTDE